ncbi:MAG TPA: hypothetical protein VF668_05690 [Pyrinomonadaceae bacterium]
MDKELEEKSWAEFLEAAPPGGAVKITDLSTSAVTGYRVVTPDLQLHCESETCGGARFFAGESQPEAIHLPATQPQMFFLIYVCRNCRETFKEFALRVIRDSDSRAGVAVKLGEFPPFGPPTPARVMSLIGPDRAAFIKGRRAENQGLGIGAFAYYRRVVENQKGRLIEKIAEVAARLGADANTLERFNRAKNETQFSRAIDDVKGAFPQALLIQGQNPLSLLHSALSEGLHAQSDEDCLELATSIRVVLSELAERISQALKDEAELRSAVSRLLKPKS